MLRTKVLWIGLTFFLGISSLFIGVQSVPMSQIFHLNHLQEVILWNSRVPRTISLILAGATLSVCGFIMQQLSRNRFVSPTTAGTMDSARMGILVSMLLFPASSLLSKTLIAFLFALLCNFLFFALLQHIRIKDQTVAPLIGMMFGSVIGAIATFIAYQFDLIQNMNAWLQGNFSLVNKGNYELLYLVVPLLLISYLYARYFTIASLGKDMATNVGLNYQVVQMVGLLIVSLASSVTLITVGNLPFLGVIIPNIVAIFKGDQLRNVLWDTAFLGSCFLIVCDIVARIVIYPYEVSVSLIMGILGSFIFILLLYRGVK